MFWRRTNEDPAPAEIADARADDFSAVRIYMADEIVDGWIMLRGERLSDTLNAVYMVNLSLKPIPAPDSEWLVLERDRILLATAPPHLGARRLRRHRVKRRLVAETGPYAVEGIVHLIAGTELEPFLARTRQHFLPITDARIASGIQADLQEFHPALLVNVAYTGHPLMLEAIA